MEIAVQVSLALVALIVSIIAFAASVFFFKSTTELQQQASRALTEITVRLAGVQTQVSGVVDRTLDVIAENFGGSVARRENVPPATDEACRDPVQGDKRLQLPDVSSYVFATDRQFSNVTSGTASWIFIIASSAGFNLVHDSTGAFTMLGIFAHLSREQVGSATCAFARPFATGVGLDAIIG